MSRLLLPADVRAELEAIGTPVRKAKGSILFRRGDEVTGLYLVVSGTVTLAPDSNVPHSLKTAVGPGAVAGLPATVSGQPFRRTAVVTEDAHLVFVARPAVLELFRAKPQFCLQAIHTLGEEMLAVHTGISALTDRRRAGDRH